MMGIKTLAIKQNPIKIDSPTHSGVKFLLKIPAACEQTYNIENIYRIFDSINGISILVVSFCFGGCLG